MTELTRAEVERGVELERLATYHAECVGPTCVLDEQSDWLDLHAGELAGALLAMDNALSYIKDCPTIEQARVVAEAWRLSQEEQHDTDTATA